MYGSFADFCVDKVDKYGRKIVDKSAGADLKRYYRLEDEEKQIASSSSSSSSEDEAVEDSSSSSDDEDDSEPEMLVFEEVMAQHPLVNQDVVTGEATCRLAIVNLDWDQIKALDILHMLQGFKPPTGLIESVKIYPSEFGKERLAKEAIEGPPKDIFQDGAAPKAAEEVRKPVMLDEAEDFDETQLRKYQLERLRYFYAVVTCDSVATAASLYAQCDGAEFEKSANFLDVRYIPDSVSFDDDEATDVSEHLSKSYRPKTDMITPALQHSKVKLTWDQDDPDRVRLTRGRIDVAENDLRAYLASSSEDEDEVEMDPEQYRKLLLGGDDNVFGRKSHEDNDDLQVTFTTGFNGLNRNDDDDVHMEATFAISDEEGKEEEEHKDETVFEARLRKMREKKNAKKEARLAHIAELKAAEKEARQAERKQQKNKKRPAQPDADLDLLMLDDTAQDQRHFDMAEIVKAERKASKKTKRKGTEAASVDGFKIDVEDDRFKAVFDEPSYAIDPSHPAYKPTTAMRTLINERQRRRN